MASNGFQSSYANDRPPSSAGSGGEADLASDPASSGFFLNDYKKHEDLKQMLDGNKDNLKLEAMKRIIGMVAKGKDASDLFPAVVKNVVSKNIEVKKLVYVYLTRYAEEQQDLALLSISTFQRALKDPNQLIRASALRVLSSIRVPMIVPIMQLAVKEGVNDMSPYVRKTAAHAIPKLYSLEPEQKDILIEVIEKLLADKTTLVAGSAIQAFEEVCPERIDLIHKNYRKLCNLLVDVDEWGQVAIINMLTRYCRTQFINPNHAEGGMAEASDKDFYESSAASEEGESEEEGEKKKPYVMDQDHRLLLKTCKPLLNSRNGSVVMAVAQLYHHCAPVSEVGLVAKALIRLLRGHKEVQYVVLSNIASMSVKRKSGDRYAGMFEPYLKSFYVRSNDPTHVKLLKLEILTNLATESNISTILREFQTYVTSSDQDFAAATIQAIGRCASNIAEITDACLNGLCSLLTNRNETVVGESVVVIKKLLQMQPTEYKEIIQHLARLADTIQVAMARASILWLIGEYSDRVPKIAPDVLRKMAKLFISEEDIVKLQILNLAAKLCLTNSKQTKLLCQYVFNLAKYDQNYDIRDRARFLRALILPPGGDGAVLAKHAKKIFLATKPAPLLESQFKDRDQYQLGTLSHLLNSKAHGYQELPDWPSSAPDPSVRNVEVPAPWTEKYPTTAAGKPSAGGKHDKKKRGFYSDDESSEDESSSSGSSSGSESDAESSTAKSGSESGSEESSSGSGSESESEEEPKLPPKPKKQELLLKKEETEEEEEEEESSDSEESSSEEEESEEDEPPPPPKAKSKKSSEKKSPAQKPPAQKPTSLLLDLDDFGPPPGGAVMQPADLLAPMAASAAPPKPNYTNLSSPPAAVCVPQVQRELLNRMTGEGLAVTYRFTRTVSIFSPKMIAIEIFFTNHSDAPIEHIKLQDSKLGAGMSMQDFPEIASLAAGASTQVLMGIDFNDSTQPAHLVLATGARRHNVSIAAPVGELLMPSTMTESDFKALAGKLSGMNENTGKVDVASDCDVCKKVYEVANVLQVSASNNVFRFASRTVADATDTLVTVSLADTKATISVNCEKMVIGSMLLKDLKRSLSS